MWAGIVGTSGYLLGVAGEAMLADLKRYELEFMALIALAGALVWMVYLVRKHLRLRRSN